MIRNTLLTCFFLLGSSGFAHAQHSRDVEASTKAARQTAPKLNVPPTSPADTYVDKQRDEKRYRAQFQQWQYDVERIDAENLRKEKARSLLNRPPVDPRTRPMNSDSTD